MLVRSLLSSSLRQKLKKLKEKLKEDVSRFDRAVESAERSRSLQADDRILQSQNQLMAIAQQPIVPPLENAPQIRFPIHSVNIAENLDFTGREDELDKLYKLLVESHTEAKPISCGIHGIGGIGKTETALQFTYKYTKKFDAVFWVSADPEQGTETLRTFGNIGRQLGLFNSGDLNDPQVDVVLDWLENEGKHRSLFI